MNRAPRAKDIVRVSRTSAPEVVRAHDRGRLTLVGIDGEGSREIPCPPFGSIMLVGVAQSARKRSAPRVVAPVPETPKTPQGLTYGASGLDLANVF